MKWVEAADGAVWDAIYDDAFDAWHSRSWGSSDGWEAVVPPRCRVVRIVCTAAMVARQTGFGPLYNMGGVYLWDFHIYRNWSPSSGGHIVNAQMGPVHTRVTHGLSAGRLDVMPGTEGDAVYAMTPTVEVLSVMDARIDTVDVRRSDGHLGVDEGPQRYLARWRFAGDQPTTHGTWPISPAYWSFTGNLRVLYEQP